MAESAPETGVFDIEDSEAKAKALAEAERDVAEGKVYPHRIVRQWLARLAGDPTIPFEPDDYV